MKIALIRSQALIKFIPIVMLLLELSFGLFSAAGADPKLVLTMIMMLWMVMWWIFDVMPLGITALIPMFFLPFLGIIPLDKVTPNYSHSVIYLFLGGFILARALEKSRMSERMALEILRVTGKSANGIVIGFTAATGFLSMWISNTATAVMMMPIAISIISFLEQNLENKLENEIHKLSIVLFLTIAYASNIGGIMTPVGTPPNVVFVGFLDQIYNIKIDFWKWMLFVGPIGFILLIINYFLLIKLFPYKLILPETFKDFIKQKLKVLGKVDGPQLVTLLVFIIVCSLWIFKDVIHYLVGFEFINDTSTAILGGVLLFVLPSQQTETGWRSVLNAKDIAHLPWNIVLLFGGGMAMADALKIVGVIQMATDYFSSLQISSPWLLVATLTLMALFLTEIMSNVALCVIALPVIMNLGVAIGLSPIIVGLPAALATSFAFMMPVSTPPNAIVFGSGKIKIFEMMKAGFYLNIISIVVVMTLGWWLFGYVA